MPSLPLRQNYDVDILIRGSGKIPLARKLIRSIKASAPKIAYQLIYVDGGSDRQDLTQMMLDMPDVVVIALPSNAGAVRAINLGLGMALMGSAKFVLLLDNDCEVPKDAGDWMGRWLRYFQNEKTAAVGAVSDHAPGAQQLPAARNAVIAMGDIPILDDFALMLRKEAVAQIGLFDERFEPGLGEDLDYCVRLHEKDYQAHIAADVWLAHKGSETLSKFNIPELMSVNLGKLLDKWGADKLRQYGMEVMEQKPVEPDKRKISLLIPTLNRPEKLKATLESVRPLVEADGNIEVVVAPMQGDGYKIPMYPWLKIAWRPESERSAIAGFNHCYHYATGDILVVGGDDVSYIQPEFFQIVREEIAQLPDGEGMVDSRVNNVECLQAVTRKFVDEYLGGVFFYPGYYSWFGNSEMTARAMRAKRHRMTTRAIVSSTNPILDNSPKDATYLEGEAHHEADRELFVKRMSAGFPDDWQAKP